MLSLGHCKHIILLSILFISIGVKGQAYIYQPLDDDYRAEVDELIILEQKDSNDKVNFDKQRISNAKEEEEVNQLIHRKIIEIDIFQLKIDHCSVRLGKSAQFFLKR